jgi:hypothetical protein
MVRLDAPAAMRAAHAGAGRLTACVSDSPHVTLLWMAPFTHTRKDPHMAPVIQAGVPGLHAQPVQLARARTTAQPQLLLHIACQAGGQIPTGLPTYYLCGAPVRLLLARIAPGDGPNGLGVCPICAALDHPARLTGRRGRAA